MGWRGEEAPPRVEERRGEAEQDEVAREGQYESREPEGDMSTGRWPQRAGPIQAGLYACQEDEANWTLCRFGHGLISIGCVAFYETDSVCLEMLVGALA